MITKDLFSKVKHIEITTSRLVNNVFAGEYHSVFKGKGMEFNEVREYVPGDDIRDIDWNVTAKTGVPHTKKFTEERELTVIFMIDVSASEYFGTKERPKSEVIAEICALLSFAAIKNHDRVGILFFTDEVEKFIPPKKGKQHVLRIVHELLTFQPKQKGTNLAEAIDAAGRIMKHSGVVFLLSDFRAQGFEKALQRLARRHDVVAIRVGDEREAAIPVEDTYLFSDPETGQEAFIDTGSYAFKKWFAEVVKAGGPGLEDKFKKMEVQVVSVLTKEDYGEAIVRFFKKRKRR